MHLGSLLLAGWSAVTRHWINKSKSNGSTASVLGLESFWKNKENGITCSGYLSELGISRATAFKDVSPFFQKYIYFFKKKSGKLSAVQFSRNKPEFGFQPFKRLDSNNFMQKLSLPAGDRKHSAWLHTLNSLNLVCTSVIIVFRPGGLACQRIHL